MQALFETTIDCPYCGAQFTALIDNSAGDSDYVEDCAVCCQPIEFHLRADENNDADVQITTTRSDEIY